MANRNTGLLIFLLILVLLSSCAKGASTESPTPAPATEVLDAQDATPVMPSKTPLPATATPPQPTHTPTPTETPLPTETLQPVPLSVTEILGSLETLPFDEFMDESYRQMQLRNPDSQFANGYSDLYGVVDRGQFTDLSPEYSNQTGQLESGILELLRSYPRESLSAEQNISYAAYEWYLDMKVRGHEYADNKLLVNPVWGLQSLPVDLLSELPLETKADAEIYIARLANVKGWSEQIIEGLERLEQAEALPPRYVIEDTITQLNGILNIEGQSQPNASTLEVYTRFRSEVNQISEINTDERDALLDAALMEVKESFIPAYLALNDQLEALSSRAVDDPNQWHLPGGEDYYAYLLEYYTGTRLSADEIHTLALAEVSRLKEEIREAADELGYPAGLSMAELNQRLSEDSEVLTGDALTQKYEGLISAADQIARDYFGLWASAQVVTRIDMDAPPAFYMSPPPGRSDPGVMIINPSFSPLYVNYNEYVLVHHESIPGHHTQLALAQELDVPYFQGYYGVNPYLQEYILQAYPEGWALYGETLAWEIGLYADDPLANLGRLRLHLLRVVRSVVDTGIHARGWTLDQAAAYLEEVTGMPQNRSSLTRYIVNPGYPNGYNIGAMKIFELRQRAMDALGGAFDIREFHDVILGRGILPIGVLEQVVEDWIAAQQDQ
jgi:uncharacterized protein (DUF885 family)